MKISNSKKQLASIISENGGWRDGVEFSVSTCDGVVIGSESKPRYTTKYGWVASGGFFENRIKLRSYLKNWHQTIVSRDEYFHLYPAPDADGWIEWNGGDCPVRVGKLIDVRYRDGHVQLGCRAESRCDTELYATTYWGNCGGATDIIAYRLHKPEQAKPDYCESVTRSIPEPSNKPTIEQLAQDYRNLKDYADRKQQEADAAKADADEALRKLELAGEEIGLIVTPIAVKKESELVSEVKVGDEVECIRSNVNPNKYMGMIGTVLEVDVDDASTPYLVDFGGDKRLWCHEVKFVRRPT